MVLLNPQQIFIEDDCHRLHVIIDVMHELTDVCKLTLEDLNQVQSGRRGLAEKHARRAYGSGQRDE